MTIAAMKAKIALFYTEAKSKITTYVGLAITGSSVLADKAESLVNEVPNVKSYLPFHGAHIQSFFTYTAGALGLVAVYTRVRRLLNAKP
jgi:hypothetical protein